MKIIVTEQKNENNLVINHLCQMVQEYTEPDGFVTQQIIEVKNYRYITGVRKYFEASDANYIIFKN